MKKTKFSLIVAPAILLAACDSEPHMLQDALDDATQGDTDAVTLNMAEVYPSGKSLFIVCTSDDAALADVFGKDVLEDPEDGQNWMVQQRFDSAIITEAYQRDELDVCGGNRDEIREVTNDELTFEQRDGAWALVGERGTDVENLIGSPVD